MPAVGDVIDGKYRIEGVVGRGGMSTVYRATHAALGHEVAIKVLSEKAASRPEYVVRLEREARAVALLQSDRIVRVNGVGALDEGRIPYFVMELLCGHDLAASLVRHGPCAVHVAIECMLQMSEAVAEAHAHGLIHRDLKPANVFLVDNVVGRPRVKVLDFGISRRIDAPTDLSLTDPGVVLGTPSYMAPEQMEASAAIDERADIWSLGAIFYEMLVGHPPFAGTSLAQIYANIARSKCPRPSDARTDVGPALDAIVTRCLAVDPSQRFGSAAQLARALGSLERTSKAASRGAPSSKRFVARLAEPLADITLASPAITRRTPSAVPSRLALSATFIGALLLGGALATIGITTLRPSVDLANARPERSPRAAGAVGASSDDGRERRERVAPAHVRPGGSLATTDEDTSPANLVPSGVPDRAAPSVETR